MPFLLEDDAVQFLGQPVLSTSVHFWKGKGFPIFLACHKQIGKSKQLVFRHFKQALVYISTKLIQKREYIQYVLARNMKINIKEL